MKYWFGHIVDAHIEIFVGLCLMQYNTMEAIINENAKLADEFWR